MTQYVHIHGWQCEKLSSGTLENEMGFKERRYENKF